MLHMTPKFFFIYDEVITHYVFIAYIHFSHSFIVFYTRNNEVGGDNYQKWWYIDLPLELMIVAVLTHQIWVPHDRISINQQKVCK